MQAPVLIDTHCHLESFHKQGRLAEVLASAQTAGVRQFITIGTASDDWALYRSLAASHPDVVFYTVGLHPCSVAENWREEVAGIEAFWTEARTGHAPAPVGLGECGLDAFHLPKDDPAGAANLFALQREALRAQLAIARRVDCPVVIHSRGAFSECVEEIDASGVNWTKVVFHCFVEGPEAWAELSKRGGRASWAGMLTYKNAETVRAALRAAGAANVLFETDAPWLAPMPHRGKSNEPGWVRHTAEFAAGVLGISFEDAARRSTENARSLFCLPGA